MGNKNKGRGLYPKHKQFVDEYMKCNMVGSEAYRKVYPDTSYSNACNGAWLLLKRPDVIEYMKHLQDKLDAKYLMSVQRVLKSHIDTMERFNELYELGDKEELTNDEKERYRRLSQILKTSDYNKTLDMITKIIGGYEPERVELKSEWTIKFNDEEEDDE